MDASEQAPEYQNLGECFCFPLDKSDPLELVTTDIHIIS